MKLFARLPCALVAILLGVTSATVPAETRRSAAEPIRKFTFLIHPASWELASLEDGSTNWHYIHDAQRLRGGAYYPKAEFEALLALERQVNRRQADYIKKMGADEVLVIMPNGFSPAMRELIRVAQEHLGPRAIVIQSKEPAKGEGRDYRRILDTETKAALMDEIIQSIQETGFGWSAHSMEVLLYNKRMAIEILDTLKQRGLRFDAAAVEAVAFGEGFEQCAMSWKVMLGHYLGFTNPIESDYTLSVSGMPLLANATFKEVIKLDNHIRLYLWQLEDGRSMAFFAQVTSRFAEPPRYVTLSVPGQMYSEIGAMLVPAVESNFSPTIFKRGPPTYFRLPVFDAKRQYQQWVPPVAQAAYFVANMDFAKFREAMLNSPIGE